MEMQQQLAAGGGQVGEGASSSMLTDFGDLENFDMHGAVEKVEPDGFSVSFCRPLLWPPRSHCERCRVVRERDPSFFGPQLLWLDLFSLGSCMDLILIGHV